MLRYTIALLLALVGCCWTALFYRPLNTYLNHQLLTAFGAHYLDLRETLQSFVSLSDTLIYNVPGALWIFGLSLLGWRLYLGNQQHQIPLFFLGIIVGQGFELIQILGMTDGTFDPLDIIWNFIGFFSGWAFCSNMPIEWRAKPGRWRYILFFVVFFAAFGVDVLTSV